MHTYLCPSLPISLLIFPLSPDPSISFSLSIAISSLYLLRSANLEIFSGPSHDWWAVSPQKRIVQRWSSSQIGNLMEVQQRSFWATGNPSFAMLRCESQSSGSTPDSAAHLRASAMRAMRRLWWGEFKNQHRGAQRTNLIQLRVQLTYHTYFKHS